MDTLIDVRSDSKFCIKNMRYPLMISHENGTWGMDYNELRIYFKIKN